MLAMGIDIGTTTISILMIDGDSGEFLDSMTIPHQSFLKGHPACSRIQDPGKLWELTNQAVKEMILKHGKPAGIGMTGQMHGFLYVDACGEAVSPLYTWQDGCGDEVMEDGRTCAQLLKEKAGAAATGYGLVTHFYLQRKGLIPEAAVKMVTISDYIGMKLCGCTAPVIASDMAASWGCFDLENGDFFRKELEELGVDISYLPMLRKVHGCMGRTPEGVPVMVSLGDNQASVAGSVQDLENTVVLNIGTGSQISFGTDTYLPCEGDVELRPYQGNTYLMTGSGLCGGRAYGMLEQFYREIAGTVDKDFYGVMEQQAEDFLERYGKTSAWKIRTTFSGTRSNPEERGSIHGIGVENFHPGAMTVGMMQGILEELYEMYRKMCRMTGKKAEHLVGSGNGIRKNAVMQKLAEELFGMKMEIPAYEEEAACGAALCALEQLSDML